MEALAYAFILVHVHLITGIILPGIAVRMLFPTASLPLNDGPPSPDAPGNWAIQALALGSLWAGFQFLVIFACPPILYPPPLFLV